MNQTRMVSLPRRPANATYEENWKRPDRTPVTTIATSLGACTTSYRR